MRAAGLPLAPTFIPFTPWTTRQSYARFLQDLHALDIIEQVAPIQLAIRLLIPEGSLLLELPEVRALVDPYNPQALVYPWRNPDPELDRLAAAIQQTIKRHDRVHASRATTLRSIWELAEWQSPLSRELRSPHAPRSPTSPSPGIVERSPPKSS